MTRLHRLASNAVSHHLTTRERNSDQRKTGIQLTDGMSLVFKQSDTGAINDWSGNLVTASGASDYKNFIVTATANAQGTLLADLVWYMWINGAQVTKATYFASGTWNYNATLMPKSATTANQQQWFVNVTGPNTTATVTVKAYVLATDSVTITVAAQ